MAQLNFDEPMTLWKGKETRVAHSQLEYTKAIADGFNPHYSHQEYPTMVYHPSGNKKLVESEQEESASAEHGFSRKAAAIHLDPPDQASGVRQEEDEEKAALRDENEDLRERLERLEKILLEAGAKKSK